MGIACGCCSYCILSRLARRDHAAASAGRPGAVQRGWTHAQLSDDSRLIRKHFILDEDAEKILKSAMESLGLSARAYDRILREARTIADLAGSTRVDASQVAASIGYRSLNRKQWLRA